MSIRLSKTELEVGRLYFQEGLKPKEISKRLNISVNTVYKAISKYRKYLSESSVSTESKISTPSSQFVSAFSIRFQVVSLQENHVSFVQSSTELEAIAREIREIRGVIDRVINMLSELYQIVRIARSCDDGASAERSTDAIKLERSDAINVPEFIRDNLWVDIIRSKYDVHRRIMM